MFNWTSVLTDIIYLPSTFCLCHSLDPNVDKQNCWFLVLWILNWEKEITAGLQDPGPGGLAENNQFVTDLIWLPLSETNSFIFQTWHGEVPYSWMTEIFLYGFLISSELSAIASHLYILPPSLEVKNKSHYKKWRRGIARDEKQKRSVAASFFYYFHCCSEPTPTLSPLS